MWLPQSLTTVLPRSLIIVLSRSLTIVVRRSLSEAKRLLIRHSLTLHPSACNPPRPMFHHPLIPLHPLTHTYPIESNNAHADSLPGLTLLLPCSCFPDPGEQQAELFLRTGASFLTLTSSLLPGDVLNNPPIPPFITHPFQLFRVWQHIRLFLSLLPQQRRAATVSFQTMFRSKISVKCFFSPGKLAPTVTQPALS